MKVFIEVDRKNLYKIEEALNGTSAEKIRCRAIAPCSAREALFNDLRGSWVQNDMLARLYYPLNRWIRKRRGNISRLKNPKTMQAWMADLIVLLDDIDDKTNEYRHTMKVTSVNKGE